MLVVFVIIMSGIMFAIRISNIVVDQYRLFTQGQMAKIVIVYTAGLLLSVAALTPSPAMTWTMAFAPQIFFVLMMLAIRSRRARRFEQKFSESLVMVLLKMKSGKSFRQSFAEVIAHAPPSTRQKLSEIQDLVVFSPHATGADQSRFIERIVAEFRAADREPHAAMRRLQVFRDRLRLESEFRRKSGQVLQQTRAQALLLASLYVALLTLTVWRFGIRGNGRLVLVSILLFIAGQVWIWTGGRRYWWKV